MDKEIIIDGVKVEECSYYNKDNTPYCCEVWDNECEAQNCYYKQLKRLEQENAELKAENERLKEEILKWQKAYSRQYQINENKGYNKKEEQYRQTLQELKAIAERELSLTEKGDELYDVFTEILQKITKAEEE